MRYTSYTSPYPVIDRREKIRVKIDLQRLEYQDTTGYYEEIRDKLKLWKTKETQMTKKRYEGFSKRNNKSWLGENAHGRRSFKESSNQRTQTSETVQEILTKDIERWA